jgi:5,10-methylenetetrahydromethanopterin reductase
MKLSCAFPAAIRHLDDAVTAEALGYENVWFYDSPALYEDVWMVLALAAERTARVGLGPAVLVPDLRHVLVTASAIATLEELAPGRVHVAVGTGFTGRMVLGQRPLPWSFVERYVEDLRALLRGERVTIDGKAVQMIHPDGYAPSRPLPTPVVVAANGPKGLKVAEQLGDGVMCVGGPLSGWDRCALLTFGTVLDDGEAVSSPRVMDAAGPAAAVVYHGVYESAAEGVDGFPGGADWRAAVEAESPDARHLLVHDRHLVGLTNRDRAALGDGSLIPSFTWTGTADEVRTRAAAVKDAGATELLYAPSGPDIERELRTFRDALAPLLG